MVKNSDAYEDVQGKLLNNKQKRDPLKTSFYIFSFLILLLASYFHSTGTNNLPNVFLAKNYVNFLSNIRLNVEAKVLTKICSGAEKVKDELNVTSDFFSFLLETFFSGITTIFFLLLALWKICLAIIILSAVWFYFSKKPHTGNDFLGLSGNDRFFFSGARLSLDILNSEGEPDFLTPGLVCIRKENTQKAKSSKLWKILENFNANNQTNLELTRHILAYKDYPSFPEVNDNIKTIAESTLENCFNALSREPRTDNHFYSVLNSHDFSVLKNLSTKVIGTLVLASYASRALTLKSTGGRFSSVSLYPFISGRAILHSIPEYKHDFTTQERTILRRSLIYAKRTGALGQTKFPTESSDSMLALRAWAELMFTKPKNINNNLIFQIKVFGNIWKIHKEWQSIFLSQYENIRSKYSKNWILSSNEQLLLPITDIIAIVKNKLNIQNLKDLEKNINQINDFSNFESIQPISKNIVQKIQIAHELTELDMKLWSLFRIVLNYFGWLGGSYNFTTIPNSLIFFVFNTIDNTSFNAYTLLRGEKIERSIGSKWNENIQTNNNVQIAITKRGLEKIKAGDSSGETNYHKESNYGAAL